MTIRTVVAALVGWRPLLSLRITGFTFPTAGEIRLNGTRLVGLKPHAIAQRGVARTFQIVKPFRKLSVRENVTLAAFMRLPARRDAESEATRRLGQVGLSAKLESAAADLTLAEQKRLEIARALATHPHLLLLDEPMGGLNPTEVEDASTLVMRIRDAGVTVVLVEHVMRAIMRIFAYDQQLVGADLVRMRFEASRRAGVHEAYASMFPAPRQRWVEAMSHPEAEIRGIRHRTLLVHGRDDQVIPLSTSLTMLDWIDDSRLHIFGRCGHWTQIEHAAAFGQLVQNFLKAD